jgi:hypothetical protein
MSGSRAASRRPGPQRLCGGYGELLGENDRTALAGEGVYTDDCASSAL